MRRARVGYSISLTNRSVLVDRFHKVVGAIALLHEKSFPLVLMHIARPNSGNVDVATHIGMKVSDEFTVPMCRGHHRQLHPVGNDVAWWQTLKIDALASPGGFGNPNESQSDKSGIAAQSK